MAKERCTEAEFIALYRNLQSSSLVAKELKMSQAMVNTRRRRIEERTGVVLPQYDRRAAYTRASVEANKAIAKLQISDGVVLIGSDAHIWGKPWTTMQRAFIAFAKRLQPQAIIANGDFFDGARISRHASIGWEQKPSVRQELEAVQDYMGELAASGPAKRFWTLGNHDSRFESRLAAVAPEFENVKGIHLKDHFEQWIPCWRVDVNADVIVKHRGQGGEHADWNNVVKAGRTMVTGHDHRCGVTPYHDYNGIRWGVRCGYMCESPLDPQFLNYLEASEAVNWHPAFVVLTFRNGRLLWPELVTKHDDEHVEFRGEVIAV